MSGTARSDITSSADGEVVPQLNAALNEFFQVDLQLLLIDASERAICGALSRHLATQYPDHDVDVEYNRFGEQDLKRLSLPSGCEVKDRSVYPDIIVHKRSGTENVLVIEVKKRRSADPASYRRAVAFDLEKLASYRVQLGHKYAYFIELPVGPAASREDVLFSPARDVLVDPLQE